MTTVKIFTADGYDFWRDGTGHWGVSHRGDAAPSHCGYASPEPVARLKGIDLANIKWAAPAQQKE